MALQFSANDVVAESTRDGTGNDVFADVTLLILCFASHVFCYVRWKQAVEVAESTRDGTMIRR